MAKPPMTFQCNHCHQDFQTADYRPNRTPKNCSRACRDAAQRTKVTLTCRWCEETFQRKAYQAEWSQDRGPFCSIPCHAAWQRQNVWGLNSPTFGLETNPHGRGSHRWIRQRDAANKRDNYRCVKCGRTDAIHTHHVVPWAKGQADPHALDNLVTLCALHHREAHRALGGR